MDDSKALEKLLARAVGYLRKGRGTSSDSKSLIDRVVSLASKQLNDDLDERLNRILSGTNNASLEPFGVDVQTMRLTLSLIAYMHRVYFRSEVFGTESLPSERMILVANHGGQIPIDGFLLSAAMAMDVEPPRLARNTVDRFVSKMPFITMWYSRVGQVLGTPQNARRLLEQGDVLVSFPEGTAGIVKTFDKRYQLQPFGSGFMRLALQTKSPIVPVAIIGSEEQLVSISDLKPLAKLLGLPAIPIIPQIFMGFVLPLPTRYRIYFGDPIIFSGDPDEDDAVIQPKVREVRTTLQRMINRGLRERKAVFW